MSWICFRNAVLNPLYVGKATYSNKEKFGILEDNLKPPLPSSSESRSSPILAIEVAPNLKTILLDACFLLILRVRLIVQLIFEMVIVP